MKREKEEEGWERGGTVRLPHSKFLDPPLDDNVGGAVHWYGSADHCTASSQSTNLTGRIDDHGARSRRSLISQQDDDHRTRTSTETAPVRRRSREFSTELSDVVFFSLCEQKTIDKTDRSFLVSVCTFTPASTAIRDVREWLATFPFPPIPITSFPFPIPFPWCLRFNSHSRPITRIYSNSHSHCHVYSSHSHFHFWHICVPIPMGLGIPFPCTSLTAISYNSFDVVQR